MTASVLRGRPFCTWVGSSPLPSPGSSDWPSGSAAASPSSAARPAGHRRPRAGPAGGMASTTSGVATGGQTVAAGAAATATPAVPASWEQLDQAAAATCPGLPWAVLAAIGRVESDSGQSAAPGWRAGPTRPARRARCSSSRRRSRRTRRPALAGWRRRRRTTRSTRSTRPRRCCAPTAAGARAAFTGRSGTTTTTTTYVDTVLVLADGLGNDPTLGSAPADRAGVRGGAARRAVPVGRDGCRRLRLLRPRPGGVPVGRGRAAAGGADTVRRRADGHTTGARATWSSSASPRPTSATSASPWGPGG